MISIPHGWKLVPIEPTKEMNDAGWEALYNDDSSIEFETEHLIAWQAMIAAAPEYERMGPQATEQQYVVKDCDGFLYGPFASQDDANGWTTKNLVSPGWAIHELNDPNPPMV